MFVYILFGALVSVCELCVVLTKLIAVNTKLKSILYVLLCQGLLAVAKIVVKPVKIESTIV